MIAIAILGWILLFWLTGRYPLTPDEYFHTSRTLSDCTRPSPFLFFDLCSLSLCSTFFYRFWLTMLQELSVTKERIWNIGLCKYAKTAGTWYLYLQSKMKESWSLYSDVIWELNTEPCTRPLFIVKWDPRLFQCWHWSCVKGMWIILRLCSNAKHQVERRLMDWKLTEEGAPETYALPPVSVR